METENNIRAASEGGWDDGEHGSDPQKTLAQVAGARG